MINAVLRKGIKKSTSQCGWVRDFFDAADGLGRIDYIHINCPYSEKVLKVPITDTTANWEQAIPHCANILARETTDGDYTTREFNVNGAAGIQTIIHYRP